MPSAPRSLPSLGPWLPPHCYRPPIMQITQAHGLPRETSEPRENTAITSTACPALPCPARGRRACQLGRSLWDLFLQVLVCGHTPLEQMCLFWDIRRDQHPV